MIPRTTILCITLLHVLSRIVCAHNSPIANLLLRISISRRWKQNIGKCTEIKAITVAARLCRGKFAIHCFKVWLIQFNVKVLQCNAQIVARTNAFLVWPVMCLMEVEPFVSRVLRHTRANASEDHAEVGG